MKNTGADQNYASSWVMYVGMISVRHALPCVICFARFLKIHSRSYGNKR